MAELTLQLRDIEERLAACRRELGDLGYGLSARIVQMAEMEIGLQRGRVTDREFRAATNGTTQVDMPLGREFISLPPQKGRAT